MTVQQIESMTSNITRDNDQWLIDLTSTGEQQTSALNDLRERLKRSIYYYLSQERSDLRDLAQKELVTMAEDLSQDAVLRVMDNLDNFRERAVLPPGPIKSPSVWPSANCAARATKTSAWIT